MATILTPKDRRLEPYPGSSDVLMQYLSDNDPYVHMTQVPPGYEIPLHSHSESEVTVVLGGSARVGDRSCGAGSVLLIGADEEYAITAEGDEPLTFVVVRPRKASHKLSP